MDRNGDGKISKTLDNKQLLDEVEHDIMNNNIHEKITRF